MPCCEILELCTNEHRIFICVNHQNITYITLDESTTQESWPIERMEFRESMVQNKWSQRVGHDPARS